MKQPSASLTAYIIEVCKTTTVVPHKQKSQMRTQFNEPNKQEEEEEEGKKKK